MNKNDFDNLVVGDIVRHKSSIHTYVVTAHFGDRITAVRSVDITNPYEWDVVSKPDMGVCPVCNIRYARSDTRQDADGRHWCSVCQAKFDSINWENLT